MSLRLASLKSYEVLIFGFMCYIKNWVAQK